MVQKSEFLQNFLLFWGSASRGEKLQSRGTGPANPAMLFSNFWGNRLPGFVLNADKSSDLLSTRHPTDRIPSCYQPWNLKSPPDFQTSRDHIQYCIQPLGDVFICICGCLKIRDLSEIQNLYKHQISSWQTPPKNLGEKIMLPPIFTKWTYQLMLTNSWLRFQWPVPDCF